jgi:uncharacterized damage-inducible protein DinB
VPRIIAFFLSPVRPTETGCSGTAKILDDVIEPRTPAAIYNPVRNDHPYTGGTMYGAKELAESFRTVRANTIQIAEDIPAENYVFKATPDVMSVGQMLAHVAVSPRWQIRFHSDRVPGMDFESFRKGLAEATAQEQALQTKEQIVTALKEGGDELTALFGRLTPDVLQEMVSFPPPVQPAHKTRLEMLLGIKEHEMHHRGQLMLVERLLGIVPHLTRRREAMRAGARA